jgi:inhibitor of cysteine peptidase
VSLFLKPCEYGNDMKKTTLLLAALAVAGAARAADAVSLAPGASTIVQLPENPSTGYTWRLDADASAGLDHVAIIDNGHTRGAAMPGAPGTRRWTIRARTPGEATLSFAYQRPWEPAPVETRQVTIEIAPQKGR